jgi:hypothetical protein
MGSLNNTEENRAELTDKFKDDLEKFFIAYPASDFKMCLQNVYSGYLGSMLCTENHQACRQHDGNMLMDFLEIMSNQ